MNLINKYKPKQIEDIINNNNEIKKIIEWLEKFEINKKTYFESLLEKKPKKKKEITMENSNCLLITGKHGIGKTTIIKNICKKLKLKIETLKNKSRSEKYFNTSNVMSLLNNSNKKKITIIDELESYTSIQDKNFILNLIKNNQKKWLNPIILISNDQHNKLLSELKKSIIEIRIREPNEKEIKEIISKILKNEKIKIKTSKILKEIISNCQKDIRKLVYCLEDLVFLVKNNKKLIIDEEIFELYKKNTNKKSLDFNLFNASEDLLYNYKGINESLSIFESDTVKLPLMVHQFYLTNILANCENEEKKYELMKEITESLSWGDVVENEMYGDQNWKIRDIQGFYSCVNTSYLMEKNITKDDLYKCKLSFPKDLNKTSIKKINKKNIDNTKNCIINKDIIDFIFISKIIKELIKKNKIKECSELLKPHGMKLEHIDSLLKIEKIKIKGEIDDSKKVSSKHKKEFLKYL